MIFCLVVLMVVWVEMVKIIFLGVGDVYNFDGGKMCGGFVCMNVVVKVEKVVNLNMVYVFDGDMFLFLLLFGFDKGQNMIDLMNIVFFDLVVFGNYEFDFGMQNFFVKMKVLKYLWVVINIIGVDGKLIEGLGGVMMKDVVGVKIVLILVVQDILLEVVIMDDWKFELIVEMVVFVVKKVCKDGVDFVVGVVQVLYFYDQLMFVFKVFDVILLGDDYDIVI